MIFTPQKPLHLHLELAKKSPKLAGVYFLQEKIDGWYVSIHYSAKTTTWESPRSSAGRIIPSLEWLKPIINQQLPKPEYDLILEAEAWQDIEFSILNGLLNRSIGEYHFKDVILKCHNLYAPDRLWSLLDSYDNLKELLETADTKLFQMLPLLLVSEYNYHLWQKKFDEVVNRGGEGIVAKREKALYQEGKKNSNILKQKLDCTVDCIADRFEESFGEKGNDSLTLISKRQNGVEIRTVISRLEYKELYRKHPEIVLGKPVQIKAMQEYPDGQLRQPVFQYPRFDKAVSEID